MAAAGRAGGVGFASACFASAAFASAEAGLAVGAPEDGCVTGGWPCGKSCARPGSGQESSARMAARCKKRAKELGGLVTHELHGDRAGRGLRRLAWLDLSSARVQLKP